MGHVPLFSSERLRFCPSSGIYSFLMFSFLLVLLLLFSLHWLFLYWCYLVLIVVDLVSETIDLFVVFVVVVAVGCCLCWCCCLACCLVVLLLGFSCFLGCLGAAVLLSCMSYGLMCCSFGGWLRCLCCFHTLYSWFRGRRFFFYCPFLCCSFPDYVAEYCSVLLLLLFD